MLRSINPHKLPFRFRRHSYYSFHGISIEGVRPIRDGPEEPYIAGSAYSLNQTSTILFKGARA